MARERRSSISDGETIMIISALCFFREEAEKCGDKRYPVTKITAKCLGISESSVKRISKNNNEELPDENEPSPKKPCLKRGRKKIEIDNFTEGLIRRTVLDFYLKKIYPTLQTIKDKLMSNLSDFPDISLPTLGSILKDIGFKYKKFTKKPILMESTKTSSSRHLFLREIRRLRAENYKIFYTDETWCGQNHTLARGWQENVNAATSVDSYDQYRGQLQTVFGWRGGFKTPSGSGKRVIILHIGSEDGFLPGAELCFIGKKGTGDYHNEMNALHFEEWFRKVLTLLPHKSAIVIDQAPYHTMLDPTTRNPNMSWRKGEIVNWLELQEVEKPEGVSSFNELTKSVLYRLAKPHFQVTRKKINLITEELRPDVKLLWLPVAHCELNAIELIWAYVKNSIAKVNLANAAEKGNSVKVINDLCKETLANVTPELWKKCVQHVQKVERDYWQRDHLIEEVYEHPPIIVNVNEDSEDEDELELDNDHFD